MAQLDLGVIGNGTVASLIDRAGRHQWFCFPRFDGDPLFNALVNGTEPAGGFADIVVADGVSTSQAYQRNTAILETVFTDSHGSSARVIDFSPRFIRFGRFFCPPMLIRRIEPLSGRCRVTVRFRPSFDYGATEPRKIVGSNHLRFAAGDNTLRITTDMPVSYLANEVEFLLDRPINLIVGGDEPIPEAPQALVGEFLDQTAVYWRDWVRDLAVPFDYQEAIIRAAITLKLCTFEDTGAIVAALTTSVPEAAHSRRNWDYRYCWLRDSYFTVTALNRLGATRTMENHVRFILNAVLSAGVSPEVPLYPIVPGSDVAEREAPALAGFRGMGPVRVGNAAVIQRQHDGYGSIILTAAQMFYDERLPNIGDLDLYRQLRPIGDLAAASALAPDAGLWEYRERIGVHTHSAAMCWAALHRLGLIAGRVGEMEDRDRWLKLASELRNTILERATAATDGWLAGAFDSDVCDAAVLTLPEIGLLRYDDPRFLRTLETVEKRLMHDGFLMRYDEPDDFGKPETAFLVCSWWFIDALVAVGRRTQAKELFDRILARRNHLGLLSEDLDAREGILWGNFPQTFSMVGMILSAMHLSRSWEEGLWRAS
ncbi:glycoside hydrolase family 15 protein [Dongia sp.]|uniref:glycoside hydrolase family 15 protein n=1 Tax=Dongia sp. TaxID=1977262 RepID=UPI0035B09F66